MSECHHLLDHDGAGEEVGAATAVLDGDVGQQHAGLAGLQPGLAIDDALLLPARVMRGDLLGDEAAAGLAKEVVLFLVVGGGRAHGAHLLVGSRSLHAAARLYPKTGISSNETGFRSIDGTTMVLPASP
jgi:hypothetical protein